MICCALGEVGCKFIGVGLVPYKKTRGIAQAFYFAPLRTSIFTLGCVIGDAVAELRLETILASRTPIAIAIIRFFQQSARKREDMPYHKMRRRRQQAKCTSTAIGVGITQFHPICRVAIAYRAIRDPLGADVIIRPRKDITEPWFALRIALDILCLELAPPELELGFLMGAVMNRAWNLQQAGAGLRPAYV